MLPPSPPPPHSHTYTPATYRCLKTEQGVFTTPGYSEHIKPKWRFVDAAAARKSAEEIWRIFEKYRERDDFVGMDICRKFIMMGRTRSLRYALRPGGRKYGPLPDEAGSSSHTTIRQDGTAVGAEIKRTGKVYDQGKLDGAGIFSEYEKKCWADETYKRLWDEWKAGQVKEEKGKAKDRNSKGGANLVKRDRKEKDEEEVEEAVVKAEEGESPPTQQSTLGNRPRRVASSSTNLSSTNLSKRDHAPDEETKPAVRKSKRKRRA